MVMNKNKPPVFSRFLLRLFADTNSKYSVMGDMSEEYDDILSTMSRRAADRWYRRQIRILLPAFFSNTILWSTIMFKNYIKAAFRNFKKRKGYSFINVAGLAVGMASTILIFLWIHDELSYDRFHKNVSRIYRLVDGPPIGMKQDISALSAPPVAPTMTNDYPEIVNFTRFDQSQRNLVKYGDKGFSEYDYAYADPQFFEIFSFNFIKGDPKTALASPYSVVLTQETAKKYFGDDDPIGKAMNINNEFDVTVFLECIYIQ